MKCFFQKVFSCFSESSAESEIWSLQDGNWVLCSGLCLSGLKVFPGISGKTLTSSKKAASTNTGTLCRMLCCIHASKAAHFQLGWTKTQRGKFRMLILVRSKIFVPVFHTFHFSPSSLALVLGSAHWIVQMGCFTHVHSYRKTSRKLFVLRS